MPNALNRGVIGSYYAGQDDAAQSQQQNQLAQMRQTQFGQQNTLFQNQQQDRQKQQQLEGVRGDLSAYLVARKQGGPEAAKQIWTQLAPKYGRSPDENPDAIVSEFIRTNPSILGDQMSAAILKDFISPDGGQNLMNVAPGGTVFDPQSRAPVFTAPNRPQAPGASLSTFDKETAKQLARQMPKVQQDAINAQSRLVRLAQTEKELSGAITGTGATAELAAKRVANFASGGAAYGGDIQKTERLQRFLGESALELRNPSGGAGMPGAISDADREFLQNMAGRIENQEASVAEVLAARKAIEQRKIQVAQAANDYIKENGQLDSGFYATLQAIAQSNPLEGGATAAQPGQQPGVLPSGWTVTPR